MATRQRLETRGFGGEAPIPPLSRLAERLRERPGIEADLTTFRLLESAPPPGWRPGSGPSRRAARSTPIAGARRLAGRGTACSGTPRSPSPTPWRWTPGRSRRRCGRRSRRCRHRRRSVSSTATSAMRPRRSGDPGRLRQPDADDARRRCRRPRPDHVVPGRRGTRGPRLSLYLLLLPRSRTRRRSTSCSTTSARSRFPVGA